MNIEDLTIKQARELSAIFCGGKPDKPAPSGRVVLVVDRGWIFAGDISRTPDGYLRLDNAVHVFRWESIGFTRAITEWKDDKVDCRKVEPVEVPEDAVVFRVPVEKGWGIK